MVNSIGFILKERNMLQKDLIKKGIIKQTISKWVNRERRIPCDVIPYLESMLRVPRKFFIDDDRYCKLLNDAEVSDLKDYLEAQRISDRENGIPDFSELVQIRRQHNVTVEIKKIQRDVRNDILSVNENVSSLLEALDIQECAVVSYRSFIDLHPRLSFDEWKSIWEAISYYIEGVSDDQINQENQLLKGVYMALKENRKEKYARNQELIHDYSDLFGSLPSSEEDQ